MQNVACEMNLSETAFVRPLDDREGFELRWFTPKVEVDLCGHATLASAHVLWEERRLPNDQPRDSLPRAASWLPKARRLDRDEFPGSTRGAREAFPGLAGALWECRPSTSAATGSIIWSRSSPSRSSALLIPTFAPWPLCRCADHRHGSRRDRRRRFRLPFLRPTAGIDEDPVTGSAHRYLGPFWADRLARTILSASRFPRVRSRSRPRRRSESDPFGQSRDGVQGGT